MQIKTVAAALATNETIGNVQLKQRTTFMRAFSADGCKYLKEIVVVGDTGVGKTMLLSRLCDNNFDESHKRTIYNRVDIEIDVKGVDHCIRIHDTNSDRELSLSRISVYRDASCLVLCYAVNNKKSFENVMKRWRKETVCFAKAVPLVVIATKSDLRHTQGVQCVSKQQGIDLCRKIGAESFVECSAKKNENVKDAIHEVVRAAIEGIKVPDKSVIQPSRERCCIIL